jgi:hypothetical protein
VTDVIDRVDANNDFIQKLEAFYSPPRSRSMPFHQRSTKGIQGAFELEAGQASQQGKLKLLFLKYLPRMLIENIIFTGYGNL